MRRMVFFFNDTATTEIYTLSLHDALPISLTQWGQGTGLTTTDQPAEVAVARAGGVLGAISDAFDAQIVGQERSEEHTSELQSRQYLVCRLLLEKKKNP